MNVISAVPVALLIKSTVQLTFLQRLSQPVLNKTRCLYVRVGDRLIVIHNSNSNKNMWCCYCY